MTLEGFIALSSEERANHLWKCGTYLCAYKEGEVVLMLYRIDDFYAEVEYSTRINEIIDVVGVADWMVEKYLDLISIDDF